MSERIVVCAFFGGTNAVVANLTTQIEGFGLWCGEDSTHKKFVFDGCGQNGWMGTIFAVGLSQQVNQVADWCEERVKQGEQLVVNAVGLSRGGCACLLLAHELQRRFGGSVELNLLLFDPVPGNSIFSSTIDLFGFSLAQQTMDVRQCTCLHHVLALYPTGPLPDHYLHAPVLPLYPETCEVEEDAMLGCHMGAVYSTTLFNLDTRLSFVRIRKFLLSHGALLAENECTISRAVGEKEVLDELDRLVTSIANKSVTNQPTIRYTHTLKREGAIILRNEIGDFVNQWHAKMRGSETTQGRRLLLTIEPSNQSHFSSKSNWN